MHVLVGLAAGVKWVPARAAHHGGQLPIDGHETVIGQLVVA